MAAPTPVSALLHAPAMSRLVSIWWRGSIRWDRGPSRGGSSCRVRCGHAADRVLFALAQHDLKRLLAFHTVSQIGYMMLGLG